MGDSTQQAFLDCVILGLRKGIWMAKRNVMKSKRVIMLYISNNSSMDSEYKKYIVRRRPLYGIYVYSPIFH